MTPIRWVAAAADLLLGACCAGCGRPWWGACPSCRELILGRVPGPTLPDPTPPGFPPTVTAGPYDDVLRGLITAYKEEQALQLTGVLAQLLAGCVRLLAGTAGLTGDDRLVLVGVPSAAATLRRRGFDANSALGRRTARELRPAYERVRVLDLLTQRRGTQDQAGLTASARLANLSQSVRLKPLRRRPEESVILFDDVVTTGASLTEAARVLRGSGVPLIGACTVAATQRRRGQPPLAARLRTD